MLLTSADLESIHRYTNHHRPLVEQSAEAGCIHCGEHFATDEIREWIAERDPGAHHLLDFTRLAGDVDEGDALGGGVGDPRDRRHQW